MNNFRKLKVWEKAVELASLIYQMTKNYPDEERYGLISQMRRCTVSIASNIAEGAGRASHKEFRQFLNIATGSCFELETQLTISKNLSLIDKNTFTAVNRSVIEIQKMLHSLKKTLI